MDLKEKRKWEVEQQKNQRKEEVISSAAKVFRTMGIEFAKMTDIATEAEIGVASVYRYFKTKPELAIEAAVYIWKQEVKSIYVQVQEPVFQSQLGLEQVKRALNVFITLYNEHQSFVKFIYEFDAYVVKESISKEKLKYYESEVLQMEQILCAAIEKGKLDGSIRKDIDSKVFYYSITHALMSLCQKLVMRGDLLESDAIIDGETQLNLIIEMATNYIKA